MYHIFLLLVIISIVSTNGFIKLFTLKQKTFNTSQLKSKKKNKNDFISYNYDSEYESNLTFNNNFQTKYNDTYIIISDENNKITTLLDDMKKYNLDALFFEKSLYSKKEMKKIFNDHVSDKNFNYYNENALIFQCNINKLNFIGGIFEFYSYLYLKLLENNI